ncbi:hypothetical protein VNO78_07418 [Psophocarpus tetragonolobus]|uniref:Uncharacterized protein n=1 Tax=Psophocarpus tetragonolobus TaxID=3891 RepID=A0AAN9ST90_PSOTE
MNDDAQPLVRWEIVRAIPILLSPVKARWRLGLCDDSNRHAISYFMEKEATPCNLTEVEKMGGGAGGSMQLKQDNALAEQLSLY